MVDAGGTNGGGPGSGKRVLTRSSGGRRGPLVPALLLLLLPGSAWSLGAEINWPFLYYFWSAAIEEAKANTRLPKWLDPSDSIRVFQAGPPGIDRDPAERWVWACFTDRQTGARWTGAAPFESIVALLDDKPYPFTPTIGLHPKDHARCWS